MSDLNYLIDFQADTNGIDTAGKGLDKLETEATELAKAFQEIQNKKGLIQQFETLKTKSLDVKKAWEQSQEATKALSNELSQAKDNSKALSDEISNQSKTLKINQKELDKAKDNAKALSEQQKGLRRQVDKSASDWKKATANTKSYADKVEQAKTKVATLRQEIEEKGKATKKQNQSLANAEKRLNELRESWSKSSEEARGYKEANKELTESLSKTDVAIAKTEKTVNELKKSTKEQTNALKVQESALKNTESSVKSLGDKFGKSIQESKKLKNSFNDVNTELHQTRKSMKDAGVSARNLANQKQNLATATEKTTEKFDKLKKKIEQTANKAQNTAPKLNNLSSEIKGVSGAVGGLQGMLATLGATIGVSELIQMADAFKTLEARVKLATGEGDKFVTGFEGVQEIANRTFTNIEDTGELFARITQAGESLNLAQKEVLEITESINQAIKLSGGSAESNQAAITQLIQGLQSGVVRGEEFNSIMEQAPRLAKAMADGLGVTRGELRAMANDGELASEVVINAIRNQSDVIANEFKSLPVTVGNSLIQLKNNIMTFVGDIDKEINSSGGLASVIKGISDGIEDIDPTTVEALKEAFKQLGNIAKELWESLEQGYENLETFLNTFSGVDEADEKVGLLTRTTQGLSIAFGAVADGLEVMNIASDGFTGAMLIGIGKIKQAWESLMGQTHEASEALITQGKKLLDESAKAIQEFESKTKEALKKTIEEVKKSEESYTETTNKIISEFEKIATAGESTGEQISKAFADSISVVKTKEGIDSLIDSLISLESQGKISNGEMVVGIAKTTEKYKELEQQTEKDIEAIAKLAEESKKANDGMISDEVKHQASLRGLVTWIDENGKAYVAMANTATESARTIKDAMANTAKALGIDFELASNKVSKSMQKSVTDVQILASNFDALKDQGYNASNLIAQGLQNMADKAKNKADYEKLISLWREFGDQGKVSTKQVEAGIDAVNQKLQKSPQYLDETKKAFQELGIISKAEAEKQALAQIEAFEKVKESGQASTEQLQEALENMSSKIEASSDTAVKSWYEAEKATQSFGVSVDEVNSRINNQTQAIKEVEQADNQATQSQISNASNLQNVILEVTNSMRSKIDVLQELGATAGQTKQAYDSIMQSQFFEGQRWASIEHFANDMNALGDSIDRQVAGFENARNSAIEHTQALSGAEVTTKDLSNAQHALRQATDANVQGLVRMDSQTLSNLQSAIDSARNKMKDLADTAKDTADSIELALAKERGEDAKAREIEQSKKLLELQEKLAKAKERGNSKEVAGYERALRAQRELNREQDKNAQKRKKAEQTRKTERQTNDGQPVNRKTQQTQRTQSNPSQNTTNIPNVSINIDTSKVVHQLSEAMQSSAQSAFEKSIKEMSDAIKRRAV